MESSKGIQESLVSSPDLRGVSAIQKKFLNFDQQSPLHIRTAQEMQSPGTITGEVRSQQIGINGKSFKGVVTEFKDQNNGIIARSTTFLLDTQEQISQKYAPDELVPSAVTRVIKKEVEGDVIAEYTRYTVGMFDQRDKSTPSRYKYLYELKGKRYEFFADETNPMSQEELSEIARELGLS